MPVKEVAYNSGILVQSGKEAAILLHKHTKENMSFV